MLESKCSSGAETPRKERLPVVPSVFLLYTTSHMPEIKLTPQCASHQEPTVPLPTSCVERTRSSEMRPRHISHRHVNHVTTTLDLLSTYVNAQPFAPPSVATWAPPGLSLAFRIVFRWGHILAHICCQPCISIDHTLAEDVSRHLRLISFALRSANSEARIAGAQPGQGMRPLTLEHLNSISSTFQFLANQWCTRPSAHAWRHKTSVML